MHEEDVDEAAAADKAKVFLLRLPTRCKQDVEAACKIRKCMATANMKLQA